MDTSFTYLTLGSVAEIQTGPFGSQLHAADYVSIGVPSIMPNSIGARLNVLEEKTEKITVVDAQRLKKYLVQSNDIIYSRRGDVEKCAFITPKENDWLCGTGCLRVRFTSKKVCPQFCAYYLSTDEIKGWVSGNAVGTTMPNLNTQILQRLPLALPPLAEQQVIAAVLSSLDDKIDLLHRQNKTLEALAQTLFRQWFVEEADEGWEDTSFEKHFIVTRGLSYKGYGLSTCLNGIPLHNLNSIYEGGGYKHSGIKYYSEAFKDTHVVNPRDIIVSNTEQGHEFKLIGFPAVISSEYGSFGIFSQHLYKILPNEHTYLTREFLYYLILSSQVREQIISATNGSTVNMLSIDGLKRPQFKMPEQKVILNFSTIITQYWEQQEKNRQQIRTLTKLRDTLLPKLMSGEVRVEV